MKHHFYWAALCMMFLAASDNPKKAVLSDDFLDRLNELEKVYVECLKAGMNEEMAQRAAVEWQHARYTVALQPAMPTIPEGKEPSDKKKKDKKTKGP